MSCVWTHNPTGSATIWRACVSREKPHFWPLLTTVSSSTRPATLNHRKYLDCVGFGAVGQQVRCLLHRPFPRAFDSPDPTDAGLAQEQINSIKHVPRDGLCRYGALLGNVVLSMDELAQRTPGLSGLHL